MTRLTQRLAAFSALALLSAVVSTAHAQFFFPNDDTINYTLPHNTYVGYASQNDLYNRISPTSPTFNLISGGSIAGFLEAYNSSTVNLITGASVGSVVSAYDSSKVNISGGSVGAGLYATSSSTVNIRGGSIRYRLEARGSSKVNISGGSIGDTLHAYDYSIVTMSGGSSGHSLNAHDSSRLTMSGGSIIGGLFASSFGTVDLSGGSVSGELVIRDSGALNIFGRGLVALLVDPNYFGSYSLYSLSGKLLDGTVLTNKDLYIQNGTDARFTLTEVVPEPGSLALLVGCIGVLPLLVLRRRRK